MIRLEQVRGEILERFERVDRRFAQNEQRMGRLDQRLAEIVDRIDALRQEILAQLALPPDVSPDTLFLESEDCADAGAAAAPSATTT
jgi:hypothetical protein